MSTLAAVGLSPIEGIIMCTAIATAFCLLCVTLVARERFWRVLALAGFAVEAVCAAVLLLVFLAGGVRP